MPIIFAAVGLVAVLTPRISPSVQSKTFTAGSDGFARRSKELAARSKRLTLNQLGSIWAEKSFVPTAAPLLTVTVDRTDDDPTASACTVAPNDCSLRGAIILANTLPGTTIMVPAGTYQLTIDGSAETGFCTDATIGDLDIAGNNTTIVGAGASTTIIQQTRPNDRVFCVDANLDGNFTFNISGVTITGGREPFGVGGGGIISGAGGDNTTVQDCIISGNTASGSGSPIGGGLANVGGGLHITGTTFSANSSVGSGGGVYFGGTPGAGTLSVSNSTFLNNTSSGGNAGGLLATQGSSYTVSGSSFSGNRSQGTNGQGGGIFNESGSMSITTSSFSGNQVTSSTGKGGGIANSNSGMLTANFNRIAGNTAITGGGASNNGGTANFDDNWWGCNGGPGVSGAGCSSTANAVSGGGPVTWLQLRNVASPNSLCPTESSTLTADIKQRNMGSPLTTQLNGLPAFPNPPGTIFSNATLGTLSGASTQFVNGSATATFTAGASSGTGGADATADNQTVTASITINSDVTITSQPSSTTVCSGTTASFTVGVAGSSPTVQWQKSTDGGANFTNISGATSTTLSFTASTSDNGNQYRAVVSNACGTATSNAATLTVNTAPTISTNPASQTVCEGAPVSFTAAANGSPAPTVQWQVSTNGGGSFSDIPGATSTTLSFTAATSQSGNQYRAVFTNTCGSATTTAATLTVNPGTTATTPADQTVCQGATASFSTTANGTGPFHYAWTVDGSSFNGDNSSISVPTGSLSVGNHTVSVTVTGTCGSVTKNATLTVQENTSATTPADQTVCQGASASFSTTASGTGPFHYAWTVDGSSFNGDNSIISVPTGSLSVGNHSVSVTVTGTCGSATKNATLTVQENTSATTPSDQTVCQGTSANFSTTASGTGPFHYAWTVDGSPFNGDSSSISVPTGSLSVGSHAVSVTVSGTCGSATKNATLTVQENTSATTPANQAVCPGVTANFSTTASGTGPFHYAWTVDGSPFNGDNPSISVPTGSLSSGNHPVTVTVSGTCGSVTKSATLTVQQNTSTTKPNDQTVCAGSTASFSTTASGTGPFTFVWKKGSTVLHTGDLGGRVTITSGSSTSTLTITNVQSTDAGTYSVETTGACGTATQSAMLALDSTPPTITCPSNITAEPTCPSGAVVTYATPVGTDNCSGATTTRTAGLASGSVFPIGTTTVTYTVTDTSGNSASCSFTVTVKTPAAAIQDLINQVQALINQGVLNQSNGQGLLNKLNAALSDLNSGNTARACDDLDSFIDKVLGYIQHGTLTSSQGQPLIDLARNVKNTLGCNGTSGTCT